MIEKYTFDCQAPRLKESKKLILVKSDSETRDHIALKVLAYLLFYDPRLKVEVSVDQHYKPDLVIENEHGQVELWIDCGYVTAKKAETLSRKMRQTRLIFVKQKQNECRSLKKLLERRSGEESPIEFLSFEPGFVERMAGALQKKNEVTLYEIGENAIGLALNEEVFESELYHA